MNMTMKKLLTSAVLGLGLATGAAADGHEPVTVGFVYVGPIGDGGWTYEHNEGRLACAAQGLVLIRDPKPR